MDANGTNREMWHHIHQILAAETRLPEPQLNHLVDRILGQLIASGWRARPPYTPARRPEEEQAEFEDASFRALEEAMTEAAYSEGAF